MRTQEPQLRRLDSLHNLPLGQTTLLQRVEHQETVVCQHEGGQPLTQKAQPTHKLRLVLVPPSTSGVTVTGCHGRDAVKNVATVHSYGRQ